MGQELRQQLKKPKMLTEPSQLGLPLLPAIWLPAPSTAVFVTPVSPGWAFTCI